LPPSGAIPWSVFASSNKYQLLLADVLCFQLCRNRGFRWFRWAPELLGVPSGATLAQYTQGFQQQERSSEHNKHQNPWRLGDPTGGAYTAPQARIAGPPQAPLPLSALRASSFRTWGWSNWGNPSYCWTRAPQSLATPPCAAIFGSHCQRRGAYCLDTLLCLLEALTVYHQWQFTAVSAATVQARRQILLQARSLSWSACKLLLLNTNPISVSRQIKSFLLLLHYTSDLHQILCACYLWPWLGLPLAAYWYVMYFQFYGWRRVAHMWRLLFVIIFKEWTSSTRVRSTALCLELPGWAGARKVKLIWILLKQETVSGSGISWATCKSGTYCNEWMNVLFINTDAIQ